MACQLWRGVQPCLEAWWQCGRGKFLVLLLLAWLVLRLMGIFMVTRIIRRLPGGIVCLGRNDAALDDS